MVVERFKCDTACQAAGMLNKCMVSIFTGKHKKRTVCLYFSTPHISGYLIAVGQGHSGFWMGNKAGTPPPWYLRASTAPKNHGNWVP